jgi:hypothetical protein
MKMERPRHGNPAVRDEAAPGERRRNVTGSLTTAGPLEGPNNG